MIPDLDQCSTTSAVDFKESAQYSVILTINLNLNSKMPPEKHLGIGIILQCGSTQLQDFTVVGISILGSVAAKPAD